MYEKKGDLRAAAHMYELALERDAGPETKERLEKVREKVPAAKPKPVTRAGKIVLSLPPNPGEELSRLRTTKVGAVPGVKNGSAEFFIQLKDGGTVEAVKFISGMEELRAADKSLLAPLRPLRGAQSGNGEIAAVKPACPAARRSRLADTAMAEINIRAAYTE